MKREKIFNDNIGFGNGDDDDEWAVSDAQLRAEAKSG